MLWRLFYVAILSTAIGISSAMAGAKPDVIATIKPVHSLLASLMKGVGEPTLLIKDRSPYDYSPTQTDIALLKKADLVVWLGPELEGSLAQYLNGASNQFEMLSNPEVKILPLRGQDQGRDPYIWLDVRNAEVFVDALHDELVGVNPANEQIYHENRRQLKREVAALDRKFEFGFRAIAAGQSWLYHDTQQYFEQSYAFKVRGFLAPEASAKADTMKLLTTRNELAQLEGTCVFVEKMLTKEHLSLLVDGTQAKVAELDSFGTKYKAGPEMYIAMMKDHFSTIANCFKEIGAKYTGPAAPPKLK